MPTPLRTRPRPGLLLPLAWALAAFAGDAFAQTWTPPVGIPVPPFGIVEQAGPFTHYVDNTHPSATDSSNPNGSPTRPRLTVPTTLAAGSVVEVRGGPYIVPATWTMNGTQSAPVFVRGIGSPRITGTPPVDSNDELRLAGSHFILEGLLFDAAKVRMMASTRGVLRRNEVTRYSPSSNSAAVTPGGTENVVFDNHIHHNGDPLEPDEIDIHGVAPKEGSSRIWIVDNHIHDNGGDAIQVGSASAGEPWARFIYIGRNRMHDDRENAVDVKQSRDVIVSQNTVFGYVPPPSGSDDGTAIVVHDNPDRVWILFNRVSDSTNGIRSTGAQDGFYVIGNVVWNIRHLPGSSYNPGSLSGVHAIRAYGTPQFYAINNTVFGSDAGITYSSGNGAEIANNLVAGLAEASHHVGVGSSTGNVVKNNIVDAVARIRFGGSSVQNCAQAQAAFPSQVLSCINADPQLVDPAGLDFRLLDGSPAIDRGYLHPGYARFESLYGVSILRDADGNERPQGAAFDLGAYEGTSEALPGALSIGDVAVNEGNSGTVSAVFTVTLTPASTQGVTVAFATSNATATAGSDYTAVSGTLSFPAGATTRTIAVPVLGDTLVENDETFWVDLSGASGATVQDGQGRGTIRNDDQPPVPSLSISDVSVTEGHSGTVSAVFNVTLSAAATQPVTVAFATSNATAQAPGDYTAASGTLTFPAGTVSRTVAVAVIGDTVIEPNETFHLDLSSIVGATLVDGRGVGTIVNDDSANGPRPRFVDGTLTVASCTTYNPATRNCAGGTDLGYRTIAGAASAAVAGDTVSIRAGTYGERLVPPTSGAAGQPITYARYASEVATITGSSFDPAIDLTGRSYLVLDGLRVADVVGWLRAVNAHNNVIRNCTFLRATASGTRAGVKFIDSNYNRIESNTFEDGNDNLMLIHSDRNVVTGNTFRRGRHSLWTILCGNRNVVRGNSFHNELQKIGQVTDCEGVPSDSPQLYNATKRNLIEGNTFAYTPSSGNASPWSGIQYSAQQGIIRRNVFRDTVGPALDLTLYSNEARYNTDNRIYHNVFYKTSFAGLSIAQTSSYTFTGNVIKNNVLYKSQFVANDTRWRWYTSTLAGKPVQFLTGRQNGFLFERNDILGTAPGQAYAVTYGRRDSSSNPAGQNLAWWQQNQPTLFKGNLEVLPGFVNEDARDFRLAAGSPLIDAAAFLTTTTTAGSGTVLPVADVSYFFDGYGIAGEVGDYVQLAGQAVRARIVSINEANRTLQLDQALAWTAGQGVALAFNGSAPDVGAIER